ncbi:MAG: hypothetical protein IJ092_03075 [Atopobiaceae bacterium]|nr:hypothetical protein [Atopobiaceae bacterium]
MSATDELRHLLGERGVEWWNDTDPEPQHETVVHFEDRIIIFHENVNGTVGYHAYNTHDLTPEQAIAATLGRGTCSFVEKYRNGCKVGNVCSRCGMPATLHEHIDWSYCPNCGAKVES